MDQNVVLKIRLREKCLLATFKTHVDQDVASTGLDAYFDAGLSTELMLSAVGNPHSVRTSFLSLLAVPDTIMFRKDLGLKDAQLVIDATRSGVITVPVRPRVSDGQKSHKLDLDPATFKWSFIHITDYEAYLCQEVQLLPPAACKEKNVDGRPCGIRLSPANNKVSPLIRHSLTYGMPLMHTTDLKDLIVELKVPIAVMPVLEIECFKALARYIIPGIDDAHLVELCQKRTYKTRKVVYATVVGSADISDLIDDCCNADAKAEIVQAAIDFEKHVQAMAMVAPKKLAKAPKKTKRFGVKDLAILDEIKKYLPPVERALRSQMRRSGTVDTELSIQRVLPPHELSCPYKEGDDKSRRASIFEALSWAWAHHTKQTSEVCPFAFVA